MRHGILFFSLLVLLTGTAGGVFLLVYHNSSPASEDITKEAFVASVQEVLDEDKVEVETDPEPRLLSPAKQPTLAPTAPKSPSPPPAGGPAKMQTQPPLPSPVVLTPTSTPLLAAEPIPPPPAGGPVPQPSPPTVSFPININTAGYEELQEITGVGPAIAQRIIDYRNQNGPFQTIEEIKNVSGIGDVNFEKMKDEITVGNVVLAPAPPPPSPPPPQASPAPSETSIVEKININTAGKEELMTLWRVGSTIADRIIEYRKTRGPFKTIEEIMDVQGIAEGIFDRIKDKITI
jgi:competence protein ComEA